jgi:hypothetical protein
LDGFSPEDLAEETIMAFFASKNTLGWDESKGDLAAFLCGVLRNKFLDRVRRHRRRDGGSLDDSGFVERFPERASQESPVHRALEIKEWIANLKSKLRGDKELEDLINVIGSINGDHNINQELAAELGTTVDDIVNRRKRLKRLLAQRGNK